ncbi:MAG: hypothetical protein GF344_18475 [Chitinivibrionales bacterium]|nr:hypothetical protein [Chitinivibrionales bacterium]MBD3358638.1 hypothetical protein [Chitinivibrionales bacterium]
MAHTRKIIIATLPVIALYAVSYAAVSEIVSSFDENNLTMSPGCMGPNALPVRHANDIMVGTRIILALTAEYHFDPHEEITVNPHFSLLIPVRGIVAVSVFGRPVEYFETSEERRRSRCADNSKGWSAGDLYFQTSVELLDAMKHFLGISLNIGFKSTTGKGFHSARHINAPGYWVDLSVGHLHEGRGLLSIRVQSSISFIGWQTNINEQNDAVGYNLCGELSFGPRGLASEIAGYYGWMHNGDAPLVARLSFRRKIAGFLQLHIGFQKGIRDQLPYQFRAGTAFELNNPVLNAPDRQNHAKEASAANP